MQQGHVLPSPCQGSGKRWAGNRSGCPYSAQFELSPFFLAVHTEVGRLCTAMLFGGWSPSLWWNAHAMRWSCCSLKIPYEAGRVVRAIFFLFFPEVKEQRATRVSPICPRQHSRSLTQPRQPPPGAEPTPLRTPASVSRPPRQDKHTAPHLVFLCIVKGWLLICNSKESNDSLDYSTFQGKVFHAFRRRASPCYEITSMCGTSFSLLSCRLQNEGAGVSTLHRHRVQKEEQMQGQICA